MTITEGQPVVHGLDYYDPSTNQLQRYSRGPVPPRWIRITEALAQCLREALGSGGRLEYRSDGRIVGVFLSPAPPEWQRHLDNEPVRLARRNAYARQRVINPDGTFKEDRIHVGETTSYTSADSLFFECYRGEYPQSVWETAVAEIKRRNPLDTAFRPLPYIWPPMGWQPETEYDWEADREGLTTKRWADTTGDGYADSAVPWEPGHNPHNGDTWETDPVPLTYPPGYTPPAETPGE